MPLLDRSENGSFRSLLADYIEDDEDYLEPVDWLCKRVGAQLWSKQREIIQSVENNKKTAVASAHGIGKSFLAACVGAWWIESHPIGEAFVITTAPSSAQVHAILWEEIRAMHRKGNLSGDCQLSDNWLINKSLVGFGRKPQDYNEHSFQGVHRKYVLAILDEACGIPKSLWTAVDSITTGTQCRTLAIGNPDDPSSYFNKVCAPDSTWNKFFISVFDSPNFTDEVVDEELHDLLTGPDWVADKRREWGEDSPLWTSKVLGRFPDVDEYSVIPLGWVNEAHRRYEERVSVGGWTPDDYEGHVILGVDVARYGVDKSCIATRYGDVVSRVELFSKLDTQQMADKVEHRLADKSNDLAIVDVVGVGAGVVDKLVHDDYEVEGFSAGANTDFRDSSEELKFSDCRSAAWWNMRELLDPSRGATICLPPNDQLDADLIAPRWGMQKDKVKVESKDFIRKRVGRSTDVGDAVIQAFWIPDNGPEPDLPTSFSYNDRRSVDGGAVSWDEADDDRGVDIFNPEEW